MHIRALSRGSVNDGTDKILWHELLATGTFQREISDTSCMSWPITSHAVLSVLCANIRLVPEYMTTHSCMSRLINVRIRKKTDFLKPTKLHCNTSHVQKVSALFFKTKE